MGLRTPWRRGRRCLAALCGRAEDVLAAVSPVWVVRRSRMRALAAAEERYRSLAESPFDFLAELNQAGEYTYVSPSYRRLTGSDPSVLVGTSDLRVLHEADRGQVAARIQEGLRTGRSGWGPIRGLDAAGRTIWLEAIAQARETEDGRRLVMVSRDVTARVQAEQAAAAREAHLRLVLQNAPIVLLAFDRAGIVTEHEGAALPLMGTAPGGLVGRSVQDAKSNLPARAARVLAGETFRSPLEVGDRTIDVYQTPLRDADGVIQGGIVMGLDRTEELRAQERFRRVIDHAADAILLMDDAFRYTYVNDAACRVFGRSREALLGRTFRDFVFEENAEALRGMRQRARETGVVDHVLRMVREDGAIVHLESRTVALGDGGYHCMTRDMSPWLETQEALRESEGYLRSVLAHGPVSLLALDASGIVRIYDGTNLPTLGIEDPARYVGRHYTAIPDRVPDFGSRIERSLAGETFSAVVPVHGRTLSLHHSPIQDEQAVVTGAVVVAFDITEERALEAQVQQAQRMEAVGNLAAGVSHDFNNLLTVVLANLDVARFQEGDDADHALRQAAEAARSAAELSRQLRDIGRANMNVREPVAVAPIVREVLALLDRSLPRNIRTAVDVDAELWVTANPAQLRQVLMNLALNAAEAMPDGCTLRVTASAAAAPGAAASSAAEVSAPPAELALPQREGGYVVIAVADDGSGMDGETLAWMWDPFFSTKGKDGTGLGTAVAWGIVREHGGSLAVDSEPDHGTTVRVYLPAAAVEAPAVPTPVAETRLATIGPVAAPMVLVVDDLLPLRVATRRILEEAGYRVREAADGSAALALTASEPIDLVVLDCSMPGMSGRQVYEALQARGQPPRVLFMTGYTSDALEGLEPSPSWSLLPKPFDAATLLEASAGALRGRAA